MTIHLIWAQSINGIIGDDNQLPWYVPEDLKIFKQYTTEQTVVMGRKTWDSLPNKSKPLPKRRNIILSRKNISVPSGTEIYTSVPELIKYVSEFWVIGGKNIYDQLIPYAEHAVISNIPITVKGNIKAPTLDSTWQKNHVLTQTIPIKNGSNLIVTEYFKSHTTATTM